MIRIPLDDIQARRLEQASLQATDRKTPDRLQVVRMAHRGRPHRDIAADLGVSTRTVPRGLNAYALGGPAVLKPRKAKGQPSAIPARLARVIRRWVIEGPAEQGLDRANWTHAELADHLREAHGVRASRSGHAAVPPRELHPTHRPAYRFLRGDPEKQAVAKGELADPRAQAEAGESVLPSRDEARFPMVPTLTATLGVRGLRPTVGTRGCKDLLHVLAVVDVVTAAVHGNTSAGPARAEQETGKSETRRKQEAFAARLRHVGRLDPTEEHGRVVLVIDDAPWHRGEPLDGALADVPHLDFKRLPSCGPQLNAIEH